MGAHPDPSYAPFILFAEGQTVDGLDGYVPCITLNGFIVWEGPRAHTASEARGVAQSRLHCTLERLLLETTPLP